MEVTNLPNLEDLKDIAAETGVIASLIYHPEFYTVDNILTPNFFSEVTNQCIFWGIEKLIQSGVENIDAINLDNVLKSNTTVKKTMARNNLENINDFINMAKFAARNTYEEYKLLVSTVVTFAYKREMFKFSNEIGVNCFNPDNSLDNISNFVANGLDGISKKYLFCGDSIMFGEKIDSLWDSICSKRNEDGTFGIPSIIPRLSNYLTYGRGELALVAGATGKGKSSFFLNEATNALKRGISTMIIDTELTDDVFLPRLLANISGVTVHTIKAGTYSDNEYKKVEEAKKWIKEQSFVHEYMPTFNKFKIEQMVKKWKTQQNLGLFIYDYIKPGTTYGAAETSQSLGLMTDFIKGLAGTYDIATIAGLQLNQLTGQVADSQKPERYCDVMMYWKPKTAEELQQDGLACGNFKIQITKNRNGSVTDIDDYIDVSFKGDYMSIEGAECHVKEDTPFDEENKNGK